MPKFFNRKRELYVQDQFERYLFQCDTKQGFSEINQIPMQKRLLCVCLCFGLGPAPEVSSKLLKVPMSVLRRLMIWVLIIILDDLLRRYSQDETL